MIEIGDVSLLDAQVSVLNSCGVEDITVATGYLADRISSPRFVTSHNRDFANSNMVTSLFSALSDVAIPGPLIVSYGDIVYEKGVLESLLSADDEMSVVFDREWERYWQLRMDDPLEDAESFKLNVDGYITELGRQPESLGSIQGQYIGLMKFSAELTSELNAIYSEMDRSKLYDGKDFNNMYMTSFIQYLIDAGHRVRGVPIDNGWLEVDTAEDLEMYREMMLQSRLGQYCDLFELPSA
jgi:choline kinase